MRCIVRPLYLPYFRWATAPRYDDQVPLASKALIPREFVGPVTPIQTGIFGPAPPPGRPSGQQLPCSGDILRSIGLHAPEHLPSETLDRQASPDAELYWDASLAACVLR